MRWADDPAATEQLHAYVDVMVAMRCANLTDDLLSDLIMAESDGDELDADELRGLVAALITSGADAARSQLAASVGALAEHPDQWALLAEHPELADSAARETVRHSPIHFTVTRIATEDVELAGVLVPAGTLVLLNTAAANRDPDVYSDPDRLDIRRKAAPPIVTHDAGINCLAAHLALTQLAEALRALPDRKRPDMPVVGEGEMKR